MAQASALLQKYTSFTRQASSDSLDDLVHSNIQDVLNSVELDDAPTRPPPAAHWQSSGSAPAPAAHWPGSGGVLSQEPSLPPRERRQSNGAPAPVGTRPTSTSRPPGGAAQRASDGSGGTAALGTGGTGLDIPGNLEASLRLHKARIRGLEDEASKAARSAADREKQLAETTKELKALRVEKAAWGARQKALEMQADKQRRLAEEANVGLAAREVALKEAGKEGARGALERRTNESEVRAREVRLQRALEEVERYKTLLLEAKSHDRDGKDIAKNDSGRLLAENKRLERQRAELLVAFRKQLKLIDVLKRQKTHLEAARALQFTEEEFIKTLDMGAV